ncbi:glutamate--cysteine ligase [Amycolatopsis sp. NPDC059027]|uniref:carboxylate-amine ligase n=1 Tax=unclassified Amycolatopsis TaxID=2618356 RepID=UPI00367191B5
MDVHDAVTLGVEEEFLLLHPETGEVVCAAPRLLGLLAREPTVMPELMRFQIETATTVRRRLEDVRADLTRLRRRLADAADRAGCVVAATGVAPFGVAPGTSALTPSRRYLTLAKRFPGLIADAGTCSCHVHVGIPSRESGLRVIAELRPWLPVLLAITANSPFRHGRESGWASARYALWSRWPTARPPSAWPGVTDYDTEVTEAIRSGAAPDERGLYFYARLSPRYPTVEVRIADTCLDVEDAVLLAGLVRALTVTALRDDPPPVRPVHDRAISEALSAAARHGLTGPGLDVRTGAVLSHERLVDQLLGHLLPALDACGDLDVVKRRVDELRGHGGGAARQRALRAASASPATFVARLAGATVTGPHR